VKSAVFLFLISVFGASLALPQAAGTAAPKTVTKKTAPKGAAPGAAATKAGTISKTGTKAGPTAKKGVATKKTAAKKGAGPPAQTWRNRQTAPTAARYKEIQQALADKGYLKTEPNGVWDSNSEEAMKQFQTEKKLAPNGKINSPSLIGLGLGPKPSDPNTPIPPPDNPPPHN
jgi:hypothetical protein